MLVKFTRAGLAAHRRELMLVKFTRTGLEAQKNILRSTVWRLQCTGEIMLATHKKDNACNTQELQYKACKHVEICLASQINYKAYNTQCRQSFQQRRAKACNTQVIESLQYTEGKGLLYKRTKSTLQKRL